MDKKRNVSGQYIEWLVCSAARGIEKIPWQHLEKQNENTTCPFRDGQTQYFIKIRIKKRTALATVESVLL